MIFGAQWLGALWLGALCFGGARWLSAVAQRGGSATEGQIVSVR